MGILNLGLKFCKNYFFLVVFENIVNDLLLNELKINGTFYLEATFRFCVNDHSDIIQMKLSKLSFKILRFDIRNEHKKRWKRFQTR